MEKLKTWAKEHPQEFIRFVKFLVVGTIGAIVDFGVLNLLLASITRFINAGGLLYAPLRGLGIPSSPATASAITGTISFIAAVISNFLWNRYWVYPDSRSKPLKRQFVQFFLVNLVGILIRVPILVYTHRPFTQLITAILPKFAEQADRWGTNMSMVMAVGIVLLWNFFINRVWTYNDVK